MARSLSQRGSRADQQPGESPDLGIRQNCETLRRFINLHVPYTQKQASSLIKRPFLILWLRCVACASTEICC